MSRDALHSEENFWPSVSDMFLTLFIIALVLYSTSNRDKGAGDLFLEEQTSLECMELVQDLKTACPEDTVIKRFDVQALEDENTKGNPRTVLAAYVVDLMEYSSQRRSFNQSKPSADELKKARENYRAAISLAYRGLLPKEGMPDQPCKQMRCVRKALLEAIAKTSDDKPTPEQLQRQLQKMKADMAELSAALANSVPKEEYRKLQKEIDDLLARAPDAKALREEIGKLNAEIEKLKAQNGSLAEQNNGLRSRLNEDTRTLVMENVEKVLRRHGLSDLVQVEKDLGVIRIPSSTVSFRSGEYERFSGHDALERIAWALTDIAVQNSVDRLIDNIVIECHADTDGNAFKNEILSSNRALYIWQYLNAKSSPRLENYKNSSGLGLFSHAGFGFRVPVPLRAGESAESAAYKERCRRIDIRFNCSPRKSGQPNTSRQTLPAGTPGLRKLDEFQTTPPHDSHVWPTL